MQIKIIALKKPIATNLTAFFILLFIAIIAPLFHFQPITGPIVNASLFLSAILLGIEYGIGLGLLPSVIAILVGTLPAPLWPMIPFIIISNAILVIIFSYLWKKNFALAVIIASSAKYLFLLSTSYLMTSLISQQTISAKATSIMMSYPQLITALLGGIIAYFIFRQKNVIIK